jgi:putative transposase
MHLLQPGHIRFTAGILPIYLPLQEVCFYLYLVLDICSRKIVGWQVHDCKSSVLAADMITDVCHREDMIREQVTLHSDNRSPMKVSTIQELRVVPSFRRPLGRNDNHHSEPLFRTLKYRSEYPERFFSGLLW